jgi:multidrug resistance efflux pump
LNAIVLLVGGSDADRDWLVRSLGEGYQVQVARDVHEAIARVATGWPVTIVVDAPGRPIGDVIGELAAMSPRPILALSDDRTGPVPDAVWYVLRRRLPPGHVRALVAAAVAGRVGRGTAPPPLPAAPEEARRRERAFDLSRRLAVQRDLAGAETTCASAVAELVGADRAHCLFFDAQSGSIWSESRQAEREDDRRAIDGLVGFCARTGSRAWAEEVKSDPRWAAPIDDPGGAGDERLLAVPIAWRGEVHAVLVAIRGPRRPAFGEADAALVLAYADQAGPLLEQLSHLLAARAVLDEQAQQGLFRPEALEAASGRRRYGDVVRVSPGWVIYAYWALVALLAATAVFLVVGKVSTYSSGPAVIRTTRRTEVPARSAGSVAEIHARAGQKVDIGQTLVQLDDAEQRAEVRRLEREFDTQVRSRMLDPGDPGVAQAVSSLRLELERARMGAAERSITSPVAGIIGDVLARPGQPIGPGDVVATIVDPDSELEVVALLPGRDRPQLQPGMVVRVELAGYRYAYQDARIESVATEVVGPTEARRYLGAQVADTVAVAGPVVVVRARLVGRSFVSDDETYRYHDGMGGQAEVKVRSERVLFALMPGLKRL